MYLPELTPGQGSMLSGLFTAVGAVTAIVIASIFFSGKVKTLKEALDEAQRLTDAHAAKTRETFAELGQHLEQLNAQSSGVASGVARIEADLVDLGDQEAERVEVTLPEASADLAQPARREQLRSDWFGVRGELERRASAESIDGRTRASYARVDRRSYYDLVDKMEERGDLSKVDARLGREAFALWQRLKNGKTLIDEEANRAMSSFRAALETKAA